MKVNIKRLNENAVIPKYAHEHDAGFDLVAVEDAVIKPGETALIKTGLAFELPVGYEMQIRPRSGITLKTKLRVQLGTVDATYRGEVGVIVDNISTGFGGGYAKYGLINGALNITSDYPDGTYIIRKGDRIGQAVIKLVEQASFIEVDTLSESTRGEDGFGSTGVKEDGK